MKFPERFRWADAPYGMHSQAGDPAGLFVIKAKAACGRPLKVIACADVELLGWEHVSVSLFNKPKECPTWDEMCVVKDLFWDAEECVVQFHPPRSEYVNAHPGCLHLWRRTHADMPTPPSFLVGPITS